MVNWELMSSLVALNEHIFINSHEPQIQGKTVIYMVCVYVCTCVHKSVLLGFCLCKHEGFCL